MKKIVTILLTMIVITTCTMPVFAASDDSSVRAEEHHYSSNVKGNGYFKIPSMPKIPDISNSVRTNISNMSSNINWGKIVNDTIKIDFSKIDFSKINLTDIE